MPIAIELALLLTAVVPIAIALAALVAVLLAAVLLLPIEMEFDALAAALSPIATASVML